MCVKTYEDNNEHVKTKGANFIEFSLLQMIDDATNEQGYCQVTQTAANEEDDSQKDWAALTLGITEDEAEWLRLLFFGSGDFGRGCFFGSFRSASLDELRFVRVLGFFLKHFRRSVHVGLLVCHDKNFLHKLLMINQNLAGAI